jgi:hypothetical protein
MAVTTVFNGNLAHQTASAWVAVPVVNLYSLQVSGCPLSFVELSIDGSSAFKASTTNGPIYGEPSATGNAMLIKSPIAWARVNNTDTGDLTGIKVTILNA